MDYAMKLAECAYKKNEVPIGAVVIYNDKIIGKGYNCVEKEKSSLYHAELIAIKQSQRKQKNWRLNDCTLYVTLQPCLMCMGAIIQSRIKNVVYAVESTHLSKSEKEYAQKIYDQHGIDIRQGLCKEESMFLLNIFFNQKR